MSDRAFERLISLEPKARLASGLPWWVPPFLLPCMGPMPNHASTHCGTWCVPPGGMSQMFRLLFLGNGWADCIEIWYAVGDPLVTAYAVITGGVSLHVLTCRGTPHTAPLYLGNGLADCVQIWYVGSWQSMEWIELKRSSPVQIHEPLILIQSNPADDPASESSPVQSGHNRVDIYQIPCKIDI